MARSDITYSNNGLSLDRYAELMRIPDAAFNGLNRPSDRPVYECDTIWKQYNRDLVAQYISAAEEMRIQELSTYLAKTYKEYDYKYSYPLILDKGNVIQLGERTINDVSIGESVDYGTLDDPVTISIAVDFTATDELHVYYPGEDVEIHPSAITISGGVASISIARSRLVKPSVAGNQDDVPDYADDSNFLATVDIKRVWYDIEGAATLIWRDDETLDENTQQAKPIIENNSLGIVRVYPATYTDSWKATSFSYSGYPDFIRLKYITGLQTSIHNELLTIRLAHSLMPYKPVDCKAVALYWQKDVEVTRYNSPYGNTVGAMAVWLSDSRMKKGTGGMI